MRISDIDLDFSESTSDQVIGKLYLDYEIALAGMQGETFSDNEMVVNWLELNSPRVTKTLEAFFTYDELESVIHGWISKIKISEKPIELSELQLSYKEKFSVEGVIASPISASFSIAGYPRYEKSEGTLFLDHVSISFNPNNIFQKALSFLIKGKIQSTIEDNLPLKINEQLFSLKEKIPSYKYEGYQASIEMDQLSCNEIFWKEEGVKLVVSLENLTMKIQEDRNQVVA